MNNYINLKKMYFGIVDLKKRIHWITNKDKTLIKKNKSFHKLHNGERCFVLGNGPSLNAYDLSVLKNEFVFCVNDFIRSDKLSTVCPDCYVIADPKFFELTHDNENDLKFINKISNLSEINSNIDLFVPLNYKSVIESYQWNETLDVYYFCHGLAFNEDFNRKIDLSKMIPSMQAVVQYAVLMAIYMGFNEIYMLGTEQTNIFGNLKAFMSNDEISDYAFDMSETERKWKNKKLTEYSLVDTLRGYARTFELYDYLGIYCKKNGISIYNCSPVTLIQGIPRKDFEYIFKS